MKTATVLLAAAMLGGCATQTFVVNRGGAPLPDVEDRQNFFVNGIGQRKGLDAAELCGGADNIARVEVRQEFIDGLLGAVTFGIYTPRTAKVYCLE